MEHTTTLTAETKLPPPEAAEPPQDTSEVTLFIGFGLGNSYIFYVEGDARDKAPGRAEKKVTRECWEKVFTDGKNPEWWNCEQFENYDKPLGWTATLNAEECADEKFAAAKDGFLQDIADNYRAEAVAGSLKVVFFTPGVAVLSVRLRLKQEARIRLSTVNPLPYEALKKDPNKAHGKMLAACRDLYNECIKAAIDRNRKAEEPPGWTLKPFEAADEAHWGPAAGVAYPVFFYDEVTYEGKTKAILAQVAETDAQRIRKSEEARVSYSAAEIYVDWSEALVRAPGGGADAAQAATVRQDIETAFTIGMASWFALYLMNKLASIYLLQTFVYSDDDGKPDDDGKQSMADVIHKKSMAYMDVANAAHPIRWTDRRRDLYLLETIHRNWSSDRWWKNIEQRMALLSLHYKRLEDKRRQQADELRRKADDRRRTSEQQRRDFEARQEANTRRLTHVAAALACGTIVSAVADATTLYNAPKGRVPLVVAVALTLVFIILILILAYRNPQTEGDAGAASKRDKSGTPPEPTK